MNPQPQAWRIKLVAKQLLEGAVIAYPTEGVWGLGCLPQFRESVERILELKQRSWKQGLILVASNIDQVMPYTHGLLASEKLTLEENWPGPITYLVPKSGIVAPWVSGESDKVALRVSSMSLIKQICEAVKGPIISTSANPSGKSPATNILRVKKYFPTGIDHIFPGKISGVGASEIRDLRSGEIVRAATQ